MLDDLLPDPAARRIARARVLFGLARRYEHIDCWDFEDGAYDTLLSLRTHGPSRSHRQFVMGPPSASASLLKMAVDDDPAFREAHEKRVSLLKFFRWVSTAEVISALEAWAQGLPEDSDAWIGLAEQRLQSNAHRKAGAALAKACADAGPDERVTDLQAASPLMAAGSLRARTSRPRPCPPGASRSPLREHGRRSSAARRGATPSWRMPFAPSST